MPSSKSTKKRPPQPPKPAYVQPFLHDCLQPLASLNRDPKNCKRHGEKDLAALTASLTQFGQMKPILADASTRTILAGNGTHEAAQRLGWEWIAVHLVAGLTAEQARAYAFADNRTSQLSQWDQDELAAYLTTIETVSSDLYDALLLDDLATAEQSPQNSLPSAVNVPEQFAVVVNVPTEAAQKKLFEFLRANNYTEVKLITT